MKKAYFRQRKSGVNNCVQILITFTYFIKQINKQSFLKINSTHLPSFHLLRNCMLMSNKTGPYGFYSMHGYDLLQNISSHFKYIFPLMTENRVLSCKYADCDTLSQVVVCSQKAVKRVLTLHFCISLIIHFLFQTQTLFSEF